MSRPDAPSLPFSAVAQQQAAGRLGLWLFLSTEILLFGGFFSAYGLARWEHPAGFAAASRHTNLVLGAIESVVLLVSSLTASLGLRALTSDRRRPAARWLLLTALLGIAFLAMHAKEYADEAAEGLFPGPAFALPVAGARLFYSMYYVMTAFHGLHVGVGVLLLTGMAAGLHRGRWSSTLHPPVELGILFWHLVDAIWMILFPLLYLVDRSL